jgi:hypothetical protein
MGVWIYFVLWNIFKYQMLPPSCSRAGGPDDVIGEPSARLGGGVSDAN